ncbi:putative ras-related protein [Apostichopus japonicus]|uniref:Putative ras-related protein n=1 Tax=Stichopus japonicus TaxID=307972 RepID=A0A2G8KI46_STIJA|nr:putative ras-related protein [Apostichopus japonicus]
MSYATACGVMFSKINDSYLGENVSNQHEGYGSKSRGPWYSRSGQDQHCCTSRWTVDNYRVKIQLWDTAGQERFRSMAPMYYRKANAAFIVYDITDYSSFDCVKSWVEELKKNVDTPIVMCVLGNKCDLAEQRQVPLEEGVQFAASIGALFFETSALTNDGIQEAFLRLSLAMISLSQSAPNCGLLVTDYKSRRKSSDIVTIPPMLKILQSKITEEPEDVDDISSTDERKAGGRCC